MEPKIRGVIFAAFAVAIALAVAGCGGSSSGPAAAEGAGSAPSEPSGGKAAAAAKEAQQHINLEIRTTEKLDGEEQPRYVPAGVTGAALKRWTGNLVVKKGQTVVLRIVNHDDGSAPLMMDSSQYEKVIGGSETVDGKPVSSVPDGRIAHTFTILGVGLKVSAAIPAAGHGGADTVVLRFTPQTVGRYSWQCFTPCGPGAMAAPGWMKGTISVVS